MKKDALIKLDIHYFNVIIKSLDYYGQLYNDFLF